MTVTTTASRKVYTGNGVTTDFPTTFPFDDASEVKVVSTVIATGAETVETAFTVTGGGGSTGTVVMATAPSSLVNLTIYRETPITQETDLAENEAFFAETIEAQFDKSRRIDQELADAVARAVKYPKNTTIVDAEFPSPESGKIPVGNADGDGWDLTTVGDLSGSSVTLPLSVANGGTGGITKETARTGIGVPMSDTESKTASFTVASTDAGKTYLVDSTSGDVTATLPAAADAGDGFVIVIKKTVAANTVSIDPDGSETIDGDSTTSLAAINAAVQLQCNGSAWYRTSVNADAALPLGYIAGLDLSNNSSDSEHDIDIAVGECRDGADSADLALAATLTKQIDAAWAAGDDAGGLDTGAVASDSIYHVWLISDGSDVDALFSLSSSGPTMPSGYTLKRRLGAVVTDGSSNIRGFEHVGDMFLYKSPPLDESGLSVGTSETTISLDYVPDGVQVWVRLNVYATGSTSNALYFYGGNADELATSLTAAPLASLRNPAAGSVSGHVDVLTNTSGQIKVKAEATLTLRLAVIGWREASRSVGGGSAGGGGGGSGGAALGAPYLVAASDGTGLTSERLLNPGNGLTSTDNGAGNNLDLAVNLDTNSGLEFNSGAMRIDASTGLQRTASGLAVDINGLSTIGSLDGSNDQVMVYDASGAAIGKTSVNSLNVGGSGAPTDAQYLTLATDGDLSAERTLFPGNGIAGTDSGAGGAYTIAVDLLANGGLEFSGGKLTAKVRTGLQIGSSGIDYAIGDLLTEATPDSAADFTLILDSSTGLHKKLLLSNLPSSGAPTDAQYLVLSNNGTLTGERALVIGTGLTGTDSGANSNYTITANLATNGGLETSGGAIQIDTAVGLTTGASGLAFDINALTAEATLDGAADYLVMFDASASAHKKVLLQNLPGLDAQIVTLATSSGLANERVLTAGDGIDLTDGGAGSTITVDLDLKSDGGLEISSTELQIKIDSGATLSASGLAIDTASDSQAGIIELATDGETTTGTATDRAITPANLTAAIGTTVQGYDADTAKLDAAQEWTGAQNFNETTLSDGATISWDVASNQVASVTLGGNRTMDAPTNIPAGRFVALRVIQDGTGSRTLTWDTVFKWPGGSAPTLSTGGGEIDVFVFWSNGTNLHNVGYALDIS